MLRPTRAAAAALLAAGALATVSACAPASPTAGTTSGTASGPASGAASGTASGGSSFAGTELRITVAGGKVTPRPGRVDVRLGTKVRLVVTSDRADEVHVHGIGGEPEVKVTPGTPVTIDVTADSPGLFEVETHDSGLVLTQLEVR